MRKVVFRAVVLGAILTLAAPAFARGGGGYKGSHRGQDTISEGDVAFTLPLDALDGKSTVEFTESGGRPVVLLFASYT